MYHRFLNTPSQFRDIDLFLCSNSCITHYCHCFSLRITRYIELLLLVFLGVQPSNPEKFIESTYVAATKTVCQEIFLSTKHKYFVYIGSGAIMRKCKNKVYFDFHEINPMSSLFFVILWRLNMDGNLFIKVPTILFVGKTNCYILMCHANKIFFF